MTFGGTSTMRGTGLAQWVGRLGEIVGLLNKGSATAPAAPAAESGGSQSISANSLNITRVGGLTSLIAGAGGAALLLFKINKPHEPASVSAVGYASVGLIVAAALLAAALIMVADIRTRGNVAAASATSPVPAQVKYILTTASQRNPAQEMAEALDHAYDCVIIDAALAGLKLTLPSAASAPWQQMLIKRDDTEGDESVTLLAQSQDEIAGRRECPLLRGNPLHVYSNGESWLKV